MKPAPLPQVPPGELFGFYVQLASNRAAGRLIDLHEMDPALVTRAAKYFLKVAPKEERRNWRPEYVDEVEAGESFGEYVIRMLGRHGHGVPGRVLLARFRAGPKAPAIADIADSAALKFVGDYLIRFTLRGGQRP